MSSIQVKICGIQTVEDIEALQELDVAAAGFILAPGRRRTVPAERLAVLLRCLPATIDAVGVLVNPTEEEVLRWTTSFPFAALQLHGDESPEFCRWIKETTQLRVIKVVHVGEKEMVAPAEYAPWIDALLFDSVYGGQRGGTGHPFAWERIPFLRKGWNGPLWIAGGLRPDNVQELVEGYAPDGIDVSSGVESEGQKSRSKIKKLIEQVRKGERVHRQ